MAIGSSVELRCDLQSLDRSKSGAIWGGIWLEYDEQCFPERGWNDLIVRVLLAVVKATHTLIQGGASAEAPFFDGPLALELTFDRKELLTIYMKSPGKANPRIVATSWNAWVPSVLDCANRVVVECERRLWSDRSEVAELKKMVNDLSRS